MKLVSFSTSDGIVLPGILREAPTTAGTPTVLDLSSQGFSTLLDVIESGGSVESTGAEIPFDQVRLHPPLAHPPRVFCIGLNYHDHAVESNMAVPTTPVVFFKLTPSIIGTGDTILLPANATQPDYEAEFAFVIGKGGYRIPAEDWRQHVFGYTILNDISARDIQFSTSQWSLSKSFPTFCPMGPYLVTADEIADPHSLDISLDIDGEVLQNSNTRELIFRIPELIEYISSITPLLAGDIVSTGTPAGVGLGRTPKRWLKPGETVSVRIEGLGTLTNPVAAEQVVEPAQQPTRP